MSEALTFSLGQELTGQEAALVGERLAGLLARQIQRHTQGDSASVPVETAEALLDSICYTLEFHLTAHHLPRQTLVTADLPTLLAEGQATLGRQLERDRLLYQTVLAQAPAIDNLSFQHTLEGLGGFFARYDRMFFAQEIPCDIDYQLCQPLPVTVRGIGYIDGYLRRLMMENQLLNRFHRLDILRLLRRYCLDYQGLLINLYEPVAANVVGRALVGGDFSTPDLDDADARRLTALLQSLPPEEMKGRLTAAAATACHRLAITAPTERQYLAAAALALAPRIAAALPGQSLNGVFTVTAAS